MLEYDSYDAVASEYYDALLHPTCADFRAAATSYVAKLVAREKPVGKIADIGAGLSILQEFFDSKLVIVDLSIKMLGKNKSEIEKRAIDITKNSFGIDEFHWIFAMLGDPYNVDAAWRNISRAMRVGGQCVFCVPSLTWMRKFRLSNNIERENYARFDLSDGSVAFLRSIILSAEEQRSLGESVGLTLWATDHVIVGDLTDVRSPKISEYLSRDEPILDIYRFKK